MESEDNQRFTFQISSGNNDTPQFKIFSIFKKDASKILVKIHSRLLAYQHRMNSDEPQILKAG